MALSPFAFVRVRGGANGVGKSSIIDGFEFGLTRQSTLFQENRLGVSWDAASPHVKDGVSEVTIVLVDGQMKIRGYYSSDQVEEMKHLVRDVVSLATHEGGAAGAREHILAV